MASNQYINKVIYGGDVLLDVSEDTAVATDVASGKYFHLKTGERVQGTYTNPYDANTSDATAQASEILNTKTAYVNGSKVVGSMPNRGGVTGTITTKAQQYTIQNGYHDGSGKVSISSTEQAKIIAGNIKSGVEILGVTGSYTGSELIHATTKTVTPYTTSKTYLPTDDGNYDYYTQVTVDAIAYTEVDNTAGGKTVTIGTVDPNA